MASLPKTVEGVRKALREIEGDDVVVAFHVHSYDHRSPGSLYLSDEWHASVHLKTEGIAVDCHANDGPGLMRAMRDKIAAERKRIAETRRIAHQPKLLEYREA